MPRATDADLRIVAAYLATGSCKCAARRMAITEDAYRGRLSRLYRRFGVAGFGQLIYVLGDQVPAGLTVTTATLARATKRRSR